MMIALYIISGFILFAILWISNKIIYSLVAKKKLHPAFIRVFPVLELLIWFVFVLWALTGIFQEEDFHQILIYSVIIAVIIVLSWLFVKDFISGIILRSEGDFKIGQYIKLKQTEGKIINLGYRTLKIENQKGEFVKIPYSKISNEVVSWQASSDGLKCYETIINTKKDLLNDENHNDIVKRIMFLPWSVPNKKPSINFIKIENSKNKYLIKFYAINQLHADKISSHINTFFNENDD